MALGSVSYFRERDQVHDHFHHGTRDWVEVRWVEVRKAEGHVRVNGIIKDEVRGEEEEEQAGAELGQV